MKTKSTPATTHKKSSAEKEVKENSFPVVAIGAITDMRDKANELQAKEKEYLSRFQNVLLKAPAAIAVFDGPQHRFVMANQAYQKQNNRKEKDFLGKSFREVFPELEGTGSFELFDSVYATGETFTASEYAAMIDSDNNSISKQHYFNFSLEALKNESKEIYGLMVIAFDITEQVEAKKIIEESEAFNRSVLESSPDCVKVLDAEGRLQFMNVNGLCTMEIDDFSDFKNKPWSELWGEENKHLINEAIDKALAGNIASFQAFCPTAKGTPKWWDVMVSPVISPDSKKINSLISVSRDVTEQMNAQKKIEASEFSFRNLVEKSLSPICILKGEDMKLELGNEPLFKVWQVDNKAIGKPLAEILPEVNNSPIMGWLLDVYHKGTSLNLSEVPFEFIRKDEKKETRYFNFVYQPWREIDGTISGVMAMAVDISEQVVARLKLEKGEQKIRAIVENAPFPIGVYVGKEMIVELANQSIIDIWGKGNDVIGKSFKDILPELDNQLVFEQIQKVLTTGESFHSKNTPIDLIIDGNLRTHYFSYSFTPLYDIDGNIYAVMNTAAEVTDLNMAQKRLEASDKRFRNTMKQAPVGITILRGPEYIVEMANDAYLQIVDKKESEFVGISIFTSLPEIEESVHTLLDNVVYNAVPYHGSEVPVPLNRFGKQDVGYFDFIWHPLKEEDGKVSGVLAVVTDITEKVETRKIIEASEQQFNTLANNIQNLAWMADGEGYIFWYNQRWYDYTGTTLEEMKGQGWEKVHHPDHVNRVVDYVKKAWHINEPFELTFPLRGVNGEYRWFLTRVYPVTDEKGKIINWIGTNTDITEQKTFVEQLEEKVNERTAELNGKNAELVKMNKELESFAYISSHDLQEPLRKIQTFASRILDKEENNLSDNGKDIFKRMRNSAERMQALIQDLLTYSLTNTEERKFEKTDLNKIVEEVREDLKEELKDKHATIEATQLCEAHIIPFQFRQLLHNLIGNSLKFSNPQHPPHIKIESEIAKGIKFNNDKLLPENKYCHITVTDNGIGFEQQYNEKIFEIFQRLHGNNEYNGTGIGLAIVKKIVENHNGIITANGELNKGATFEIYIPAT